MGTINVKIHPIFILFSFIVIYIGKWAVFGMYLVSILLHEFGHFIVAKCLGYNFHSVVFMPYGVGIGSEQYLKRRDEVLIAFAGPLCSLAIALLVVAMWWLVPVTYCYTYEFATINFILGVFNLLPVLPMDGGRIYINLVPKKYRVLSKHVFNIITCALGLILLATFLYSIFHEMNLNILFMSFFLFSSLDMVNTRIYFDKFNDVKAKKMPVIARSVVVSKDISLHKLLKYIDSGKYTIFVVVENDKVVATLTETEMLSRVYATKKTSVSF